jgi:hypothetical protein
MNDPRKNIYTASDAFDQSIATLDVSIFRIESQTSFADRWSLLAIQSAVRNWKKEYVYLECGSHLGGSLLPHILDPRCRLAYSVDKRPPFQPDERGVDYEYPNNSSERMVATLGRYVTADYLAKLRTFDMDASELTARDVPEEPDLVLIDAEHTISAVFSDFLHLYRLCHASTIYAFHDASLILGGLQNMEMFLRYTDVAFDSYVLPSDVYLLAINDARAIMRSIGTKHGLNKDQFTAWAKQQLMKFHYESVRQLIAGPPQPGIKMW